MTATEYTSKGDHFNASVMLSRESRYEEAYQEALRCQDRLKAYSQAMAVAWEADGKPVYWHA